MRKVSEIDQDLNDLRRRTQRAMRDYERMDMIAHIVIFGGSALLVVGAVVAMMVIGKWI